MSSNLFDSIRHGRRYMKAWPQQTQLNAIFPEGRVIKATDLAIQVMPALAVITAAIQLSHFGSSYVAQALAIAAFFLSLPLQGMMWLGHRSQSQLPPTLANWYREVHEKMSQIGVDSGLTQFKPKYQDLALLLKQAFEKLDKSVTREFF